VDILFAVESTPVSVSTSRKIAIYVSRIQMSLSSNMVHDDYIPLLLHGIVGILYNRFSDLWPPALDCLGVLISKHKELVWSQFIQFMAIHQSKELTVRSQEKLEVATHPQCMSVKCSVCSILLQMHPYAPLPLYSQRCIGVTFLHLVYCCISDAIMLRRTNIKDQLYIAPFDS
jgi:U3 small nucleolar RNA-associated protein 20